MYTKLMSFSALGILLSVAAAAIHANGGVPGAQKQLDPATGDYVITYTRDDGGTSTMMFEPRNKVIPFVSSAFSQGQDGRVKFVYRATNTVQSKQDLFGFGVSPVSDLSGSSLIKTCHDPRISGKLALQRQANQSVIRPPNWRSSVGDINPTFCSEGGDGTVLYEVHWTTFTESSQRAMTSGQVERGLEFRSADLPGIGKAQISGLASRDNEFPDDVTENEALSEIINELKSPAYLFVSRHVAVPTFPVPSAFAPSPVLQAIRDHMKAWPQQQLMDQGFWTVVDGLLASAISAANNGNTPSVISSLTQIRLELRKKFPDLDGTTGKDDPKPTEIPTDTVTFESFLLAHDQRLAARVLDFNVAFVTRRLSLPVSGNDLPGTSSLAKPDFAAYFPLRML